LLPLLLLLLLNDSSLSEGRLRRRWWSGLPDLFALAADANDDMNADATPNMGVLSSTTSTPQNQHLQEERKDQVTSPAPTITMTPSLRYNNLAGHSICQIPQYQIQS